MLMKTEEYVCERERESPEIIDLLLVLSALKKYENE